MHELATYTWPCVQHELISNTLAHSSVCLWALLNVIARNAGRTGN